MAAAINLEATVSPEGKIESSVPQLAPGQRVHVIIEPAEVPPEQKRSAADILAEMQGHRMFKTVEEVDEYIRQERDSWDR